jgi:hypothetical protein
MVDSSAGSGMTTDVPAGDDCVVMNRYDNAGRASAKSTEITGSAQ